MKFLLSAIFSTILFTAAAASADCTPPPGGKCLTKEQLEEVKKALVELDQIHKSPAVVTTPDTIVIVHDWQGRVYVNGGDKNPIHFHLKLGETVDRDMAVVLPTQVYYREQPPDSMFRLRIRAQAGVLLPELTRTFDGLKQSFWDAGIGWDFFHYDAVNVSAYTGVRSVGAGVGLDLTRNFGPYLGYSLVYDGWRSSALAGMYLSFN